MILPKLPLLDFLLETEGLYTNKPFEGYALLAVQHLLGSTATLLQALVQSGIVPHQSYVVGKAYSSYHQVITLLTKQGFKIVNALAGYRDNLPYDTVLEAHIDRVIARLVNDYQPSENRRVLLIDDAVKAIRLLHTKYPELAQYFHCVEQTSRGVREVAKISLMCPVINVARSWAKKQHEAPLIAHSMIIELQRLRKEWQDIYRLPNLRVVLIGYGVIGAEVCKQFKIAGFEPIVFDQDSSRLTQAGADGNKVVTDLAAALPEAGLVAGCTGKPSLRKDDFDFISPRTLLVNMGSSDLEFSPWLFRGLGKIIHCRDEYGSSVRPDGVSSVPWRSLFQITWSGRDFYLANGGFPIDFSGSPDPIPPKEIQITRALLLGGALQAVQTRLKGLIDLDDVLQHQIAAEYQRLNPNPLWGINLLEEALNNSLTPRSKNKFE